MLHPDLEDEQRFLDGAYESLDAMRSEANRLLESVLDLGKGGTFQSRTERDIVVRTSLARLAQLEIGDQALCFGRIDRQAEAPGGLGEAFHIGRLAVSSHDHEPLIVDWRAPVAEPFYRATGLDPQGLARRRHLAVRHRSVIGLEDEYFIDPELSRSLSADSGDGSGDRLLAQGLGGPGALLAALGAHRTGQMADIVATIQREQDEIIRAPMTGLLTVQGGPGTGKTAVALHRAAYLLYTHRFPLERQGVLVVGPNPLFLRYIEQVLPSLGETGVTLSTVPGLVAEVRVTGTEAAEVARLKGDVRMSRLLRRAVRTRQRPLRDEARIPFGAFILRLSPEASASIVDQARRRPGAHNARRRFVESRVLDVLVDQYQANLEASSLRQAPVTLRLVTDEEFDNEPDEEEAEARDDLIRQLRRVPEVIEALDRMWPRLSAPELLHDLFGARALLRAAARGVIDDREADRLFRTRAASLEQTEWTVADTALIDEARMLLGPKRTTKAKTARERRERANASDATPWPTGLDAASTSPPALTSIDAEEPRAYGHIVVDEIQDLSPMQLRMLARRSISGSMTVVGDIAQATGPWAPTTWDDIALHLSPKRPPRRAELSVSYRTPAEVIAVAAKVLAQAAPNIRPPQPVRSSGIDPLVIHVEPDQVIDQTVRQARQALAGVGGGRIGLLVNGADYARTLSALLEAGVDAIDPRVLGSIGLAAPLVVLPADEVNGLEFDTAIIVEPAAIVAGGEMEASTRGLRTLYVALTRLTQRLVVIHSAPLPW